MPYCHSGQQPTSKNYIHKAFTSALKAKIFQFKQKDMVTIFETKLWKIIWWDNTTSTILRIRKINSHLEQITIEINGHISMYLVWNCRVKHCFYIFPELARFSEFLRLEFWLRHLQALFPILMSWISLRTFYCWNAALSSGIDVRFEPEVMKCLLLIP